MFFDSVDNKVSCRTANCFSYLIVAPLLAMSRVNIYSLRSVILPFILDYFSLRGYVTIKRNKKFYKQFWEANK